MGFVQRETVLNCYPEQPVITRRLERKDSLDARLSTANLLKNVAYGYLTGEGIDGVFTDDFLNSMTVSPFLQRFNETKLDACKCVTINYSIPKNIDSDSFREKMKLYENCLAAYACGAAILSDSDHAGAGLTCDAGWEFYEQFSNELATNTKWRSIVKSDIILGVSASGGIATAKKYVVEDTKNLDIARLWYQKHGKEFDSNDEAAYQLQNHITSTVTGKKLGKNKALDFIRTIKKESS